MEPTRPQYHAAQSAEEQANAYDAQARYLSGRMTQTPVVAHAYGPHAQQRIEVYRPPHTALQDKLPVLIFLHGGAWIAGDLEWLRFMAPAVNAQDIIFVAVSYRLAPNHRWPAQLDDAVNAVNWAMGAAPQYGGNTDRVALGGHSAGGHIAAMSVLTREIPTMRACMPISGPMDLRYDRVPSDTGHGRVYRYLLEQPEHDVDASPICALEGNTIPFHFAWGEHDFERIMDSSTRMAAAMQQASQRVTTATIAGASHFDTHLMLQDATDPWYRTLRAALA